MVTVTPHAVRKIPYVTSRCWYTRVTEFAQGVLRIVVSHCDMSRLSEVSPPFGGGENDLITHIVSELVVKMTVAHTLFVCAMIVTYISKGWNHKTSTLNTSDSAVTQFDF